MRMRRHNPGQFGTAERSVTDHYKTLELAARILETEHGTRHKAGEREDMCPKCKQLAQGKK